MTRPSEWEGFRSPDPDATVEAERTGRYWDWLDAQEAPGEAVAEFVTYLANEPLWVRKLTSSAHADHEAHHMRHSIGHSWTKYSGLGDIFSIRSEGEVPQATILVAGNEVIHARGAYNLRLSEEMQSALHVLCDMRGWTIRPEQRKFDHFYDGEEPNTLIRTAIRLEDGSIGLQETVLEGILMPDQADIVEDGLDEQGRFNPGALEELFGDPGVRAEFICIASTSEPATSRMTVDEFVDTWENAPTREQDELASLE